MDNEFIVCVYINVDISNQLAILNPEWEIIYIYYLLVNRIIIHKIICICLQCLVTWYYSSYEWYYSVNEFYALCKIHIVLKDVQWLLPR